MRQVGFALTVLCLVAFVSFDSHADEPAKPESEPTMVKVILRGTPLRAIVGELITETDEQLEILDIASGKKESVARGTIASMRKDVSDKEISGTIGLAKLLSWRIRRVVPSKFPQGAIAKVDGAALYVSLAAKDGIRVDQELLVYRGSEEIKDPKTGEVLGRERRRIARVRVTEVQEKFCKAKLIGDLETDFAVGDLVEPTTGSNSVAVLPIVNAKGEETVVGRKLAEELTTGLVNAKVSIVERTRLADVLKELSVQQSSLVDPETAQKVGKQVGAYAVLIGTTVPNGRSADAHVRLVDVQTGKTLVAASTGVNANEAVVGDTKPKTPPERVPENSLSKQLTGGVWRINYGSGSVYVDVEFRSDGTWSGVDLKTKAKGENGGRVGGKWKIAGDKVVAEDHLMHSMSEERGRIFSRCTNSVGKELNSGERYYQKLCS